MWISKLLYCTQPDVTNKERNDYITKNAYLFSFLFVLLSFVYFFFDFPTSAITCFVAKSMAARRLVNWHETFSTVNNTKAFSFIKYGQAWRSYRQKTKTASIWTYKTTESRAIIHGEFFSTNCFNTQNVIFISFY